VTSPVAIHEGDHGNGNRNEEICQEAAPALLGLCGRDGGLGGGWLLVIGRLIFSDIVLVQHFPGFLRMADVLKILSRVTTCGIEHNLAASGMLVEKLRDIIHFAVNGKKAVVAFSVLLEIRKGENLGIGHSAVHELPRR